MVTQFMYHNHTLIESSVLIIFITDTCGGWPPLLYADHELVEGESPPANSLCCQIIHFPFVDSKHKVQDMNLIHI